MIWLAFGLGLILGTVAGILVIGLLQMGTRPAIYEYFPDRVPYWLEPSRHSAFMDEAKQPSPVS
ncbi:MAG: hypothetical protein GX422_08600 [Deltaproteobacteria bacterium]|jgi:hypothetical protein|nr:hypothetical protein [Deltaproteobacteria bacterium]